MGTVASMGDRLARPLVAGTLFAVVLAGLTGAAGLLAVMGQDATLPAADAIAEAPAPPVRERVPWTLYLIPESPGGEEYVLSGTMEPPSGVEPDQEIQMVVYYTDGARPEWIDPMGLVRTPDGIPSRVASQVYTFVTPSRQPGL